MSDLFISKIIYDQNYRHFLILITFDLLTSAEFTSNDTSTCSQWNVYFLIVNILKLCYSIVVQPQSVDRSEEYTTTEAEKHE